MTKKRKKGFTLIELLIVIVIIGLLTGVLLVNYNSVRQRGRDAKRKADLLEVASGLEIYKADYGDYPTGSGTIECEGGGACAWGEAFSCDGVVYMSKLPKDPLAAISPETFIYSYTSDGTTYTLESCLENGSDTDGTTVSLSCGESFFGYQVTNP